MRHARPALSVRARALTATVIALAAFAAMAGSAAAAAPAVFAPPVKLAGARGGTEPRVAISPAGIRYVATNDLASNRAVVYRSTDGGATFVRTETDIPGQTRPTIDVDVVVMPNGRLLASELDVAGLNFPTGYSDDGGKTWTQTGGPGDATLLGDQDRQWFAVGPKDPATGKYRVYLLYHNLGSGAIQHNMFVATSTDSGASFGPPVPTTVPGDQAYLDLQCSDSGGPGSVSVDQRTGQVVVVFGTRTSALGGCGASVFGPFEINVVGATRVWVATSKDGSAGSWTQTLPVDRSMTNQIVGMQLATGAIDDAGNVYVAFPESPRAYPDYDGGAIKYVWSPRFADGGAAKWSAPVTVAAPGGAGNIVPHVVAGDAGKVAFAWYHGTETALDPEKDLWFATEAQTLDATSAQPTLTTTRLSDVPAYFNTASKLMGACGSGPSQGIQNGFACSRSTDVWGMAIDPACRVTVTWPAIKNTAPNQAEGTYVSTQTAGPALCGADEAPATPPVRQLPGAPQPTPPPAGGGPGGPGSSPAAARRLGLRFNRFGGPASR